MGLDVKQGNTVRRTGDTMSGLLTAGLGVTVTDAPLTVTANAGKTVVISVPAYTTANAPTDTEGNIYYDLTLHKLRVRGAAGYETITSA